MHIHITNLNPNTTDSVVRMLFSAYGEVEYAVIVRDKLNGRSKGMAFVEMPNATAAGKAIVCLDRTMVEGKKIVVSEVVYSPGKSMN